MMHEDRLIRAIGRHLAQERQIVLDGAYHLLPPLIPEKERLLGRLAHSAASPEQLRVIAAEISRNQTLLRAATQGFGAARDRLAALAAARDGLVTYGRGGERDTIAPPRQGFDRRF